MPDFGAGKAYRIWTRKRGPPQFFKRFCCLALPGAPNCEPCFGVAVWPRLVCPLNVLSQYPPLLRVGKQKARKSLFKSCQAPRRVEPSEDAFSTEA